MSTSDRVAAVIILYHPQESVPENVRTYLAAVGRLYLWDNSPGECVPVVESLRHLEKTVYLTEGSNAGVARPLNIASQKAACEGYEYLLTMDQDSYGTDGMVDTMLNVAGDIPSVGLISPYQLDRNAPLQPPDTDIEPVKSVLTSGNLVSLSAHAKVGGFEEDLFIDYVDTEYSLRLQAGGFGIVRVNRAILSHAEGHFTPRKFFGGTVYPANHSPSRFYYRARNRLFVRRRYRKRFPEFIQFMDTMYWHELAKMLLFEKQRLRKLVMVWRGFIAFRRDDYSSIPTETP